MERTNKTKYRYAKYAYLFLLPFFAVYAVFAFYPMIYSILLSFTDLGGIISRDFNFVGFENYAWLIRQPVFLKSFLNTFIMFALNFLPQIVFALFFAALFTSKVNKVRGQGAFKVIYFMPNIITAASIAVLFSGLLSRGSGPVHQIFVVLGLVKPETNFFLQSWSTRIIIAFIQFWMWFGNSMIIFISGILGISPDVFEAARIDGANASKIFFHITLPLLKPIMLYSLVTSMIGGLQMFDIPYLLNSGGPNHSTETVAMFIYVTAFDNTYDKGIASAASVYLFMLSLVISMFLFNSFRERKAKGV